MAAVPGGYLAVPGGYLVVPGDYLVVPGGYLAVPGGYLMVPGGYLNKGFLMSCSGQLKSGDSIDILAREILPQPTFDREELKNKSDH